MIPYRRTIDTKHNFVLLFTYKDIKVIQGVIFHKHKQGGGLEHVETCCVTHAEKS